MSRAPNTNATKKTFSLVDATEPNLLEDTFDYHLPPRIKFDGPVVEYVDGQSVTFDPQSLLKSRHLHHRHDVPDGPAGAPRVHDRSDGAHLRPVGPA